MSTHLFIGGVADGLRLSVPNDAHRWVYEEQYRPKYTPIPDQSAMDVMANRKRTYYRKECLRCADRSWFVFVVEGEQEDAIPNLIGGYHASRRNYPD